MTKRKTYSPSLSKTNKKEKNPKKLNELLEEERTSKCKIILEALGR